MSTPIHHVVIADDNSTNQLLFEKVLERAGFSTKSVATGEGVLDELGAGAQVDAVLLDICMPEMDGIEAIKLIRFMEVGSRGAPSVPVIAMTADYSEEMRQSCLDAGADEFLVHPIHYDQLIRLLKRLISEREESLAMRNVNIVCVPEMIGPHISPVDIDLVKHVFDLGGRQLLEDMARTIRADCEIALNFMQVAMSAGDATAFKRQIMSIFSSTAPFGAVAVRKIFDATRHLDQGQMKRTGRLVIERLRLEASSIVEILLNYCVDGPEAVTQAV